MDVLITGAAGKTGLAVVKALKKRGMIVRALVRSQDQVEALKKAGAAEVIAGDMTAKASYKKVMDGVRTVYHICPNVHPGEKEIGSLAIKSALRAGLEHFVYHSVLHPQVEKMPHHWNKMRVEEMLFESGLSYTILQPAPYMQNILAGRDSIFNEKSYRVPYPTCSRISMVDLEDLGEAAAIVLSNAEHRGAVYEIVGTEAFTQDETAVMIGKVLGREVVARQVSTEQWLRQAEKTGMGQYQVATLLKMFDYYARYGLGGSSYILCRLIGRRPNTLPVFLEREMV